MNIISTGIINIFSWCFSSHLNYTAAIFNCFALLLKCTLYFVISGSSCVRGMEHTKVSGAVYAFLHFSFIILYFPVPGFFIFFPSALHRVSDGALFLHFAAGFLPSLPPLSLPPRRCCSLRLQPWTLTNIFAFIALLLTYFTSVADALTVICRH